MNDHIFAMDLTGLPKTTAKFVLAMNDFGLGRTEIHGLFVLVGLYAGTPRPMSELKILIENVDAVIPTDRTENIDERVGDFYDGYESILAEFCYRSGLDINFREITEIKGIKLNHTVKTLRVANYELLDDSVEEIGNLLSSSRLYWSLITQLGKSTSINERALEDAFSCGVFQAQLLGQSDVSGMRQLSVLIESSLPIFLGQLFRAMKNNQVNYSLGLSQSQVPLMMLIPDMDESYARQMWGFQSGVFYKNQEIIEEAERYDARQFHDWVVKIALDFSSRYPNQPLPFSQSGLTLHPIPVWADQISQFNDCDQFIKDIWGYDASDLRNPIELSEYKALVIHTVYSSLTSNREAVR